ncbi:hypothetical protein B7494_g2974 [Chlorociboria aeruginascens]|nr:hypothetical protein B7494_g2974 [Chlorociboria aeruginascens]
MSYIGVKSRRVEESAFRDHHTLRGSSEAFDVDIVTVELHFLDLISLTTKTMAGDIRENPQPRGPPPGETSPPEHVQTPKVYEVFHSPPENANALPEGSGQNTAGSRQVVPKISAAARTIKLEEFKHIHTRPCVREAFLTGMGAGFVVGGGRAIFGARIPKAANWAVGAFVLTAFANYEFCQYRRHLEKVHMKRAVEIIDRKREKHEAEMQAKRDERRRAKEEMDKKAEEARKSSWKFW